MICTNDSRNRLIHEKSSTKSYPIERIRTKGAIRQVAKKNKKLIAHKLLILYYDNCAE